MAAWQPQLAVVHDDRPTQPGGQPVYQALNLLDAHDSPVPVPGAA
jgi:hypothetical protein